MGLTQTHSLHVFLTDRYPTAAPVPLVASNGAPKNPAGLLDVSVCGGKAGALGVEGVCGDLVVCAEGFGMGWRHGCKGLLCWSGRVA